MQKRLGFLRDNWRRASQTVRSRSSCRQISGWSGLIPGIKSPGKLSPQRLQKIILIQADKAKRKGFAAYRQLNLFVYDLFSGVQDADEILSPPFHLERDDIIIRYNDGTDV